MEIELKDPGKNIAQWTDNGERLIAAITGLSLIRRAKPTQPHSHVCMSHIFV